MSPGAPHPLAPPRRQGFTILEILVAMTIFALVTTAVFAVFRAALRSRDRGERETRVIQQSRYALDSVERDVTNIFFRDETSYNVALTSRIQEMERFRMDAEETGSWDEYYSRYGDPDDPKSMDAASVGNPYDSGILVDVQLEGKDSGDKDSLTFAVMTPLSVGQVYHPLGLARVKYFVNDKGWLLRSEEGVETAARDQMGNKTRFPSPPLYLRLAEGVEKFDIYYSFWYDNQWYEVSEWNSNKRQIRNPRYILGDYRDDWRDRRENNNTDDPSQRNNPRNAAGLQPGDPGWNEFLNDQSNEPLDRIPATIRIVLSIKSPDSKGGRPMTFERSIRVPTAEETYTPSSDLTDEERESERDLRDQKYSMIYPGALEEN